VGSGVVAVVLYPMRKDLIIDLGNRRPSGRKLKWYEGYASVKRTGELWTPNLLKSQPTDIIWNVFFLTK